MKLECDNLIAINILTEDETKNNHEVSLFHRRNEFLYQLNYQSGHSILHRKRTAQRGAENDTRKGFKFLKKSEKSAAPTGVQIFSLYSSNFEKFPETSRTKTKKFVAFM